MPVWFEWQVQMLVFERLHTEQLIGAREKLIKAAVVGYGYWGPNIVRNLFESADFTPVVVVDKSSERLKAVERRHPSIVTSQLLDLEVLRKVDAVFICTPASSHFELAKECLTLSKHVWLEKPVTTNLRDVMELNSLALKKSVSVMADHTYTFSPSVEKIKEYIDSGVVGKLLYYESLRFNLGIFQPDVSVIWDLAIHDLSIIGKLVGFANLEWVSCVGFDPLGARQKSIATITMGFSGEFSVHITVNWLSPLKIRKVILGGQSGSIVFDDTEPSDKIALYAQEFDRPQSVENRISDLVSYKLGETKVPRLKNDEPLSVGIRQFAKSIEATKKGSREDRGPLFETEELIKILEMCETSMEEGGARIAFKK